MDIIGSGLGIIIVSPLLIISAILIKITSEGPIIFKQKRMGLGGKEFGMYKFRTMVINAEEVLMKDPKLLEEYKNNSYKIRNDPRVTTVGKIFRKTSIDELPQLLNILTGEMSIVGPRAYKKDEIESQLEIHPELKEKADVVINTKPGLTGVWQTSGRSEIGFDKRLLMDYEYATKKSILFDIWLIIKTVPAVLKSRGAW